MIYTYTKGDGNMKRSQVKLKKQPLKYIAKAESKVYNKLRKALDGLEEWKGDIKKIESSDYYRLKIPQYRLIFLHDEETNTIWVETINTRTNINYGRYQK
jgi:mRNA-degrading endonuclease RelE of RelBE toxin-antitoxin system